MNRAPNLCVVLMAAGQSRRMGGADKLLLSLNNIPLLADRLRTAQESGFDVLLALPPEHSAPQRWNVARSHSFPKLTITPCPDTHLGLGHSLSAAFSALNDRYDAALVVLADMPALTAADLRTVAAAFAPGRIARGQTSTGKPGHPVLIPRHLFPKMRGLTGDQGAQQILRQERVHLVPLPDHHAEADIDTPEDWQRLQNDLSRRTNT